MRVGQVSNLCPIQSEETQGGGDLAQWGKNICAQCGTESDQERICHNNEEKEEEGEQVPGMFRRNLQFGDTGRNIAHRVLRELMRLQG